MCFEYYKLDPANYITAASFSWDAMLLKTDVKLEQISDQTVLDILERQKRGGLCFVGSKRHVVANNKYTRYFDKHKTDIPINIDDTKYPELENDNYIVYLDANNLYGWAMSEVLPYKDVKIDNVDIQTVLNTPDDNDIGYIVECDITFPDELHEKLKEFPPCPETLTPDETWMSEYQINLKHNNKIKTSCSKLIPHLLPHNKYCIHYRNLKYINELGAVIGDVHNVVSFKQKRWLEPYITFNTDMRKKAKNEFEKDFFKLMNNSIFGKTMENVKNRMNLHITTDDINAETWFSKPVFKNAKLFEGLYLIETYKTEVLYDKPLYVGVSILDISKLKMMSFHYDVIQKNFENNFNLIYSDTDSFVYDIKTPNLYKWIKQNSHYFDLSDSQNPELKDNTNKKVLGVFKDECNSLIIKEFTALNPKVYSFVHHKWDKDKNKYDDNHNKKTLKGISKAVVKKDINNDNYLEVLKTNEPIKKEVVGIRSFNHQLFTVQQNKVALTSWYDKMCMIDGNNNVPFGYKYSK